MRITKGKSVDSSVSIPAKPEILDVRKRAVDCIKGAIDILTEDPEDQIFKDSIANLSVVILDLTSDSSDDYAVDDVVVEEPIVEEVIEEVIPE